MIQEYTDWLRKYRPNSWRNYLLYVRTGERERAGESGHSRQARQRSWRLFDKWRIETGKTEPPQLGTSAQSKRYGTLKQRMIHLIWHLYNNTTLKGAQITRLRLADVVQTPEGFVILERRVDVTPQTAEALGSWLAVRRRLFEDGHFAQSVRCSPRQASSPLLFPGHEGKPFVFSNVKRSASDARN